MRCGSEAEKEGQRQVRSTAVGHEWVWGWSAGLEPQQSGGWSQGVTELSRAVATGTEEINWPGELRTSEETVCMDMNGVR